MAGSLRTFIVRGSVTHFYRKQFEAGGKGGSRQQPIGRLIWLRSTCAWARVEGRLSMWTCSKQLRCALAIALFASPLLLAEGAGAQDRPKVEIVPSIRHSRMITSVAL